MVRRFLCLGTILLLLLSVPACGEKKKEDPKPAVPDPLGNEVPKPAGGKGGPKGAAMQSLDRTAGSGEHC